MILPWFISRECKLNSDSIGAYDTGRIIDQSSKLINEITYSIRNAFLFAIFNLLCLQEVIRDLK
jgi:hypothetical protein